MSEKRILIAESHRAQDHYLAESLRSLGYEVVMGCNSGEEVVRRVTVSPPDLVLIDVRLSGRMDGIDTAIELQSRVDVPVVFFKSRDDEHLLARIKQANPYGMLTLPLDGAQLRSVVEIALYKHEADRRVRESETRHRFLFEHNPIPLWEEDFSAVRAYVEGLKASGIMDIRGYLHDNPQEVWECAEKVKVLNVNRAAQAVYEAAAKPELLFDLTHVLNDHSFDAFLEEIVAVAEGWTEFETETVNCTLQGNRINGWLKWSVAPGYEQTYALVIVSVVDVTEQKAAVERLHIQDQANRAAINGLAISDMSATLQYVNPAFLTMWGYEDEQNVLGRSAIEFWFRPEDAAQVIERIRSHGGWTGELVAQRADGSLFDVQLIASLVRDRSGEPRRMLASFLDITQRKKAEEQLEKSLTTLSLGLDAANMGGWDWDLTTGEAIWSERNHHMLGYEPQELKGNLTNWKRLVHPDDWPGVSERLNMHLAGRVPFFETEHRLRTKSGDWRWFQGRGKVVESSPDGRPTRMAGVIVDITDRKKAEQEILKIQGLLEKSQAMAHVGSWELDLLSDRLVWSDEVYRIFGMRKGDVPLSYAGFLDAVHPDDRAKVDAAYEGSIRDGSDSYEIEHRIVREDSGEVRYVHEKCEHLKDSSGNVIRSTGMVQDITQRKRVEQALEESRKRLSAMFDACPEPICVTRLSDGAFLEVNAAFTRTMGYTMDELDGIPAMQLGNYVDQVDRSRMIAQLLQNGKVDEREIRFRRKDGSVLWGALSAVPLDLDGQPCVLSITRDITERKRAEEALAARAQELRLAFEHAPDGIFWADAETGEILRCNEAAEKLLGRDRKEIEGLHQTELHPPEARDYYRHGFRRHADQATHDMEGEVQTAKGTRVPVRLTARLTEIGGRKIVQGIFRDITRRKEAEEQLRESEFRLRTILENMPVMLAAVDEDLNLLAWNRECERVTGFSEAEMVGNPDALSLIYPDARYRSRIIAQVRALPLDFRTQEWELTTKTGEQRTVVWSSVSGTCPVPGWHQWAIGLDVTDLRRAEKELRAVRDRLETAIEGADLTLWEHDLQTGQAVRDDRWARRLGYEPHEIEPTLAAWGSRVHPDDVQGVIQAFNDMVDGRTSLYQSEHRLQRKSGEWTWNLARAKVVEWNSQGAPKRLSGVSLDITKRKEAEEALRNSEAQMRAILEGIAADLVLVNPDQEILWVNNAAASRFGLDASDMKGRKCYEFLAQGNRLCNECPALKAFQKRRTERAEMLRADGRIWEETASPVLSHDGTVEGVVCIAEDITHEKRSQELLVQAEKYKAVADLTAGVAHNFNNLLQILLGNAVLALMNVDSGDFAGLRRSLQQIIESSKFGAETVRRLNRFARAERSNVEEAEVVDLSEVVEHAVEMSTPWWKSEPEKQGVNIRLHQRLARQCTIRGNKSQLFEIVVNLLRNAVEALPEGGTIDVTTFRKEDSVCLRVRDTGVGISEDHLNRLFTPFFTTSVEAGRGLGLATCRTIADSHGGRIHVESIEGKGSTFTVRLPWTPPEPMPEEEAERTRHLPRLQILLIDDMEGMLTFLTSVLEKLGHKVFTALSGEDGLKVYKEARIDLVICDLGMRGMNGWEVGRRVKEMCRHRDVPKTPFIILTGWDEQEYTDQDIVQSAVDSVVSKPVEVGHLVQVIQTVTRNRVEE